MKHNCNKPTWAICTTCNRRLHKTGCTSKRNPKVDCMPNCKDIYLLDSCGILTESEVK